MAVEVENVKFRKENQHRTYYNSLHIAFFLDKNMKRNTKKEKKVIIIKKKKEEKKKKK